MLGGRRPKVLETFVLGAGSVADVRRALPLLGRYGRAREVVVAVLRTDRTGAFVVPSSLTGAGAVEAELRTVDAGAGGALVRVVLREPATVHGTVRAVVSGGPAAGRSLPAAGLRVGVTDEGALPWASGDPWARAVTAGVLAVPADDIPPVDVVVGVEVRPEPPGRLDPPLLAYGTAAPAGPRAAGWTWAAAAPAEELVDFVDALDDAALVPPVDCAVVSPVGFRNDVGDRTATLVRAPTAEPGRWAVRDRGGADVTVVDLRSGLTENDVARLRPLRHVTVDPSDSDGPAPLATLLGGLAAAGVPLVTGPLPESVRTLLGPVAGRLESLREDTTADAMARESWSVTTRREALLRLSSTARWRRAGEAAGRATAPQPSVSVILPTKRPANLRFALDQLRRQTWPDVEVVVALHGVPGGHPDVTAAVAAYDRPVQVVPVDGSAVFGDVLNVALDRCSGRFVAKMDDDDWYGPDHLTDLLLAHAYSGAMLVGLADHFVYLAADDTTVRDTAMGTERLVPRVSGGTLLLARDDLLTLGRWRPVRRAVDRCLLQAVAAVGGHTYAMHDLGFCLYRGSGDHTWNPGDAHFLAREPQRWPGFRPPGQAQATPR